MSFLNLKSLILNQIQKNLFVVYLLAFFLYFSPVYAQENSTFFFGNSKSLSISPVFQDISIQANEKEKIVQFRLFNRVNDTVRLRVIPVDIIQENNTGKIQFVPQSVGSKAYGLASHMAVDTPEIDLNAGETKVAQATIFNDNDLSPGGHYGGLIFELIDSTKEKTKPQVVPQVGVQIFLRKIGGEKPAISLESVNWPIQKMVFFYPSSIEVNFSNRGNIHLVPYGRIEINDMFKRTIYKAVLNESSVRILPLNNRGIFANFIKLDLSFPVSFNKLLIQGNDSLGYVNYSYERSFIYINPIFLVILAILLIISAIFRKKIVHFWKNISEKFKKQKLVVRK